VWVLEWGHVWVLEWGHVWVIEWDHVWVLEFGQLWVSGRADQFLEIVLGMWWDIQAQDYPSCKHKPTTFDLHTLQHNMLLLLDRWAFLQ